MHWSGLDQSSLLTHFPPGDTYNFEMQIKDVEHHQNSNKDSGLAPVSLMLFGWGDGGGGPLRRQTEDMATRISALGSQMMKLNRKEKASGVDEHQIDPKLPNINYKLTQFKDTNITQSVPTVSPLPSIVFTNPEHLFKMLEKNSDNFNTVHGELYLEFHRATYTSQKNDQKW